MRRAAWGTSPQRGGCVWAERVDPETRCSGTGTRRPESCTQRRAGEPGWDGERQVGLKKVK